MKKIPLFSVLAALALIVTVGVPAPTSWAQSDKMPKLINPNLSPRISAHMTDEQDPYTYRGRWTGLSNDLIYVDKSPFRITPNTYVVGEGGLETITLTFEPDKSAEVKFVPDKESGEEGVPIALSVRIYPAPKQ